MCRILSVNLYGSIDCELQLILRGRPQLSTTGVVAACRNALRVTTGPVSQESGNRVTIGVRPRSVVRVDAIRTPPGCPVVCNDGSFME